jgi:hypothetical protein
MSAEIYSRDEGRTPENIVGIDSMGGDGYGSNMEPRIGKIEARLDVIEPRIAKIEARLDVMDTRLDGIESTVAGIKSEVSQLRLWILGSVLAFIAAIITFGQYQASWFQSSLAQGREELRSSLAQTTEELRRTTDIKTEELRRATDSKIEELGRATDSKIEELRRITDRQWEMTQKALEKASDAAVKAEALRLIQEEREKKR